MLKVFKVLRVQQVQQVLLVLKVFKVLQGPQGNQGVQGATGTAAGGATGVDYNDNVKVRFGTGNDLEIYHSGSKSFITNNGSTPQALAGDLVLRGTDNVYLQSGTTDETFFKGTVNGAAELYYDNSKKFETKWFY